MGVSRRAVNGHPDDVLDQVHVEYYRHNKKIY